MGNTVVIGAQWGDEGKAKITDLLAQDADMIIRYQGGCNAGHTVVVNDETFKFHIIPSGILYKNKICMIGAGTVIHPESFEKELNELIERGVDVSGLKISPLASITMPYHIDLDGASENSKSETSIGTTKKGIGPTYSDKIGRYGFKIQDLFDDETLNARIEAILPLKNKILKEVYGLRTYSKDDFHQLCLKYRALFASYVCENWQEVNSNAIKNNKKILFEGAQGVMLDIDYGTYPFVTSSSPCVGGAVTGAGMGLGNIKNVIGVFKAYITRVGEGPFVSELTDEKGDEIRKIGAEFGVTTGRPRRCGWFDAVVAKYAALVSSLTGVALTKLDVFDTFEKIKICTAYKDKRNGKIYNYYPTNVFIHKYLEPVYEEMDGWKQDITRAKTYDELPENAKRYLKRLEELIGVPITIISVGPDREQTIILQPAFK